MFATPDDPDAVRAAVEETLERAEEHHRNSALPLLGLPTSWVGERQTGASSVHRSSSRSPDDELDGSSVVVERQWETVELIHGAYPDGPWLSVVVTNAPAEVMQTSLAAIVRDEQQAALPDSGPFGTQAGGQPQADDLVETTTVLAQVEGELVALEGVSLGGFTVARAVLDGWTLTVKSRGWPLAKPVQLTRLDDVEAYLSGRRRAVHEAMGL